MTPDDPLDGVRDLRAARGRARARPGDGCASSATASSTSSSIEPRRLDESRVWRGASRAEMESRLREPPPEGATPFEELLARPREGRPALHRAARPPALLRLHPELADVARRPRRPPRERDQHLRRDVAPVRRREHRRARRHRLVPPVARLRRQRRRGSSSRAARSRTSPRSRARGRRPRAAGRRTPSSTSRRRALVGDAGAARPRVPARPGARPSPWTSGCRLRPDALAAAIEADVRAGRQPFLVVANAGATNTGAVDPLARGRRRLRGARTSGSTWTPRTAASRCSPSAAASSWPGSTRPTRSRSIRTSGSTSRTSAAA